MRLLLSRRRPSAIHAAASAVLALILLAGSAEAAKRIETTADASLRERIEAQLDALPDRSNAEVRVAVRNGQVLLLGRVRLLEQSLRAEQLAWKTSGVLDVDNELRVVPVSAAGDAAIEQEIRRIIKVEELFLDTNLRLEVVSGIVRLQGLFQDPTDVLALKHRIASIPGVLAIEIEARLVARKAALRELERT